MSHRTSQYLALGATIIMFVLQALAATEFFGPNPVGQTSRDTNPLLVPAGYAFSIWGPIYLGLAVFPIYQLITKGKEGATVIPQSGTLDEELAITKGGQHPAWIEFRQLFALNVVLNGLWLVFASYSWQWLTVATIVVMLITLFRLNQLLIRISMEGGKINFFAERLVFSLYFAWITLATVLNVASALHFYDWTGFGISQLNWTYIIGAVAIAITSYTALKFRDFIYPMVVIWAFTALAVRHWESETSLVVLAAIAIAAALGVMVLVRPTNGPRTQVQGELKKAR